MHMPNSESPLKSVSVRSLMMVVGAQTVHCALALHDASVRLSSSTNVVANALVCCEIENLSTLDRIGGACTSVADDTFAPQKQCAITLEERDASLNVVFGLVDCIVGGREYRWLGAERMHGPIGF